MHIKNHNYKYHFVVDNKLVNKYLYIGNQDN